MYLLKVVKGLQDAGVALGNETDGGQELQHQHMCTVFANRLFVVKRACLFVGLGRLERVDTQTHADLVDGVRVGHDSGKAELSGNGGFNGGVQQMVNEQPRRIVLTALFISALRHSTQR